MAYAREDLEEMTIAELQEIVGVKRSDLRPGSGADGRVVKSDWVEAALEDQGQDPRKQDEALRAARAEAEPFRGVSAHTNSVKRGSENRFQVMCSGRYVGKAATADEGARLYDEALLELDLDPMATMKRANFPEELPEEVRKATSDREEAVEG